MSSNGSSAWLAALAPSASRPPLAWSLDSAASPHPALTTAVQELTAAFGADHRIHLSDTKTPALRADLDPALPAAAFHLQASPTGPVLTAADAPALLHGVHHFLREHALGRPLPASPARHAPAFALRIVSQWDNLDGSIERGYAGRSLFTWSNIDPCLPRVAAYARLLASVGLNGIVLNNVTAQAEFLAPSLRPALAAVADVFRAHGLRVFLSVNSGAPLSIGGLPDADPLNPAVATWWSDTAAALHAAIPDFGGFCVKADCEGVPGPHTYGRTHADGANCLAAALAPFGGLVLWRTFVYPLPQDATAYHYFRQFDGAFADNVVLMIKNGPVDFQPVEPLHPLFGQTPHTRQMLEVQAIQEYTGQTTHACYLGTYWHDLLATDLGTTAPVPLTLHDHLVSPAGVGIAAVSNIGDAPNWFLNPLNGANLYAYGRLAWDPAADPAALARDWASLTFGPSPEVVAVATRILLESHPAYCAGTHPYGLPFLTDYDHFRPMLEKRQHMHDADADGIGKDRTSPALTGSWQHYPPAVAARFRDPALCPEALLLFFHHLPWDHRLADGRTLADAFAAGVAAYPEIVAAWQTAWSDLAGQLDATLHAAVAERLSAQHTEALLWRDALLAFFDPQRLAKT